MKELKNSYDLQAETFLKDTETAIKCVQAVPQKLPKWAKDGKSGINWYITIENKKGSIGFDFWDSIYQREIDEKRNYFMGHYTKPSPYSILASIYHSGFSDFEDFCSCFGYDTDSITSLKTFEEVSELNKKLEKIFSAKELERLAEIN